MFCTLLNNFSSLENALPVSRPDMEIGEKVIFLVNSSVVSMMTMLTLITLPLLRKGRKNAFLTLKFLYLGPKVNFLFWNRDISSHGHLTNTPRATPQKFSTRKNFPLLRRVSFSEAHPGFWPFQASAQSQVFILWVPWFWTEAYET